MPVAGCKWTVDSFFLSWEWTYTSESLLLEAELIAHTVSIFDILRNHVFFFTAAALFYLLAMQRALTSPYPHQCFPSLPPSSSSFFPYLFWHKLTVWLRLDSNLWTYCLSFLCADLAFSFHTHPNMHEMVSQNVHFPNDQRYWAPLRMLLTTCLSVWVYIFKPFAHYLRYCSYEKTPWPR